jgi:hypothetical protein
MQFLAVGTVALLAGVVIGWQLDRLFGSPPSPRGVPRMLPVPFPPSAGLDGEETPGTGKTTPTQRLTAQDTRPTNSAPKAVSQ